jgi:hypothetical protein
VVEAIRACELELSVTIATPDDQHALLIEDNLRRPPDERLRRQVEGQAGIRKLLAAVGRQSDDL